MDTLSPVIEQLALTANTFFSGTLCADTTFNDESGPGHLHLLRHGHLTLHVDGLPSVSIKQPSVILFAPPVCHRLEPAEPPGAELVCAEVTLESGNSRLLPFGIPNPLIVPLADARGLKATLDLLFDEALENRPGARAAINRLMELLFVLLLRHCCNTGDLQHGLLAYTAYCRCTNRIEARQTFKGYRRQCWLRRRHSAGTRFQTTYRQEPTRLARGTHSITSVPERAQKVSFKLHCHNNTMTLVLSFLNLRAKL